MRVGHTATTGEVVCRVDRGGSALGNPFVVRAEGERDAACDAYGALLEKTLAGETRIDALALGRAHGFGGEVRWWDAPAARDAFAGLVAERGAGRKVCLACHCRPLRCHAEEIACALVRSRE